MLPSNSAQIQKKIHPGLSFFFFFKAQMSVLSLTA